MPRDGRVTNGVGLIDDYQYLAMGLQLCEHSPQLRFILGQGTIVNPCTRPVQRGGMMGALAHIKSTEHINLIVC